MKRTAASRIPLEASDGQVSESESPLPVFLCTCFRITSAAMVRLIRERPCRTVEDVAEATGACRGCQTCRPDVEDLLKAEGGGR